MGTPKGDHSFDSLPFGNIYIRDHIGFNRNWDLGLQE